VTNATSHTEESESGGGVLADDMGMGKSLSILSLVAKTSGKADKWLNSAQEETNSFTDSWKTRSRASLVIVSSACKCGSAMGEKTKHHSVNS
jgi:SWI/SNF-related matrix-associated actin-dependent regulator of chromatin subfamily A3